jgi:hypothetical protein
MVYGSVININMVWESAMQRAASGLPRDSTWTAYNEIHKCCPMD